MISNYKRILKEICNEEKIKCTFLSKDWVTMLEKDGITRFITGYKFDLNNHAFGSIADDKYALYDVLNHKGIPVAEHNIVYAPNNKEEYAKGCNTYEYVHEYFKKHKEIVLKPNNGACGHGVYKVIHESDIDEILDKLLISNFSISMCPFYHIKHEYRLVMLDGVVKVMYMKESPKVIGDGKKTIRELLLDFNYNYFKNRLKSKEYDVILPKDETYEYNWKFNLSQGSIEKEIKDEELKNKLISISKKVCKETTLKFGSVDIIETDNKLLVLEVNSGVMFDNFIKQHENGYNIAKSIYKEAINKMFEIKR